MIIRILNQRPNNYIRDIHDLCMTVNSDVVRFREIFIFTRARPKVLTLRMFADLPSQQTFLRLSGFLRVINNTMVKNSRSRKRP